MTPFCEAIGFEPKVLRSPTFEQVAKTAPDLVVFDCRASVPNRWVQLLLQLRQTSLFEATPVLVASTEPDAGLWGLEITKVAHVVKPFELDDAVKKLTSVGLDIEPPTHEPFPALSSTFDRRAATQRLKSDKFRVLDSPSLLEADLQRGSGPLGCAVLYLDIDHFKQLNTRYLEREVDRSVLIPFQRLLNDWVGQNGHVYAEGGDEVIVFLPNATPPMAKALGDALVTNTARERFRVAGHWVQLTISIGLATAQPGTDLSELPDAANFAKRSAKERGRNQLVEYRASINLAV